jgi:hypothetical protein
MWRAEYSMRILFAVSTGLRGCQVSLPKLVLMTVTAMLGPPFPHYPIRICSIILKKYICSTSMHTAQGHDKTPSYVAQSSA